jgi:hypothetical protein
MAMGLEHAIPSPESMLEQHATPPLANTSRNAQLSRSKSAINIVSKLSRPRTTAITNPTKIAWRDDPHRFDFLGRKVVSSMLVAVDFFGENVWAHMRWLYERRPQRTKRSVGELAGESALVGEVAVEGSTRPAKRRKVTQSSKGGKAAGKGSVVRKRASSRLRRVK